MARACRRRPPPESGLPTSFDLVRVAEALLVFFFFFITLYTTVFVRSFQVTKHDHFNVSLAAASGRG
jgi:hypothetical protein